MRWTCCLALAVLLAVGSAAFAAQDDKGKPRIGFISHVADLHDLLPEEAAAFNFCRINLELPIELVPLQALAEGKARLSRYDVVWWHYASDTKLPQAALAERTVSAFNRYVRRGGSLLLSLQACQYVAPLGIDVAPDSLGWKARAEVPELALRSKRSHGIFGLFDERFLLCMPGTLQPATFARWVKAEPRKGRLLAYAVIDGQEQPTYRSVYEWRPGDGIVIAVGEYGFNFGGPNGNPAGVNRAFAVNIIRYLTSPASFEMELRTRGKQIATTRIGYLSKISSGNTLFVERGSTVDVEVVCMPRQEKDGILIMALCEVDDEGRIEIKDWVIREEISMHPGREIREKGRFGTATKPGLYHLIALVGDEKVAHLEPRLARRIYVVRTSGPNATASDKGFVYAIETKQWLLELEKVTGAIKGLLHKQAPDLNFAANEFNSPLAAAKDLTLLGSFFVTSRTPGSSWLEEASIHSTDVRTADIEGDMVVTKFDEPSRKLGGFNNVRCASAFWFNPTLNCIEWRITVKNPGDKPIEVGDVHIPLAFNNASIYPSPDEARPYMVRSTDEVYERRLIARPDICGASSHVVFRTRSGEPPFLVLLPAGGTWFECLAHDQRGHKSRGRQWEGLPYVYLYSKASSEIESWGGWFNRHHSFTLDRGGSRTLGLRLFWAMNEAQVDQILAAQGRLVTHLSPGYVVPANMPATLRLSCSVGVGGVAADKGTTVEQLDDKGLVHRVTFSRPGPHEIRVTHGRGEVTTLHVYSLPPLPELAAARAAFILEHQQFKNAEERRYLAFGMWDSENGELVSDTENKERSGGSTVTGIGPPLFVAAKNTVFPEPDQVAALEQYIDEQLFGRIQDHSTYRVHTFVDPAGDGPPTDSYVYPHVFNLYLAMYRIGTYYGLTKTEPVEYLTRAYRTAMAYLDPQMQPAINLSFGHPGEGTLGLIIAALHREGLSAEASQLQQAISLKVNVLAKQSWAAYGVYVAGQFWPADTAGISGTYWLSRLHNWQEGVTRSVKVLEATRGIGRHWMWYGCDLAWAGELAKYPTLEATTLNHPSAYNAAALLDAAVHWRNPRYAELGYAGLLAPWARVKPTGEPQGFYAWEPKLMRFDPYSGDVDAALAPTFFYLGAYVAYDRSLGLLGYGCHVSADQNTYSVIPADGMGKRVVSVPHQLVFEVGADRITKMTATKTADRIEIEVARGWAPDHDGSLAVTGLLAGSWTLRVDGGEPQSLTAEQLAAGVPIPFTEGRTSATFLLTKQADVAQ